MKNKILKHSLGKIKNNYKRFISLLCIAFLGVGFYSSIQITAPEIVATLDDYYDKNNVYDIRVMSTLGLTKEDIEEINKIDAVEKSVGLYSEDVYLDFEEEQLVAKIYGYNENINDIVVLEGNLPQNINECVIEKSMAEGKGLEINDNVKIIEEGSEDDKNFTTNEFKIVGIVQSPLYILRDKGTTTLGSGSIDYYMYVNEENIDSDIYTEIAINVHNAKEQITDSNEYNKLIANVTDKLELIKEERQNDRYNEIIEEATQKLNDAENEFNTEKADAESKIKEAESKIQDAKNEIANGKSQIRTAQKELSNQRINANTEFANAEKQIQEGEEKLNTAQEEFNVNKTKYEEELEKANQGIAQIDLGITSIEIKINELNQSKETCQDEIILAQIESAINECNKQKEELQTQKDTIQSKLNLANEQLTTGQEEIDKSRKELENSKIQLSTSKQEAETKFKEAETKIANSIKDIENAKIELQNGETELEQNKTEFDTKIAEAEEELNNVREEINDIEKGKWYIMDRTDDSGYNEVIGASESITNIGKVFPLLFYIIAIFIGLISMMRMVEEDRVENGTLKALGYSSTAITMKYIIYSLLATVIGGLLGILVLNNSIPRVIWTAYQNMLFDVPGFTTLFDFESCLIGLIAGIICICGCSIYVSYKNLRDKPSNLMRPKAPKVGKRVFLEKINFIWKRVKFSNKITIRNIFRYKSRVLATIIGIAGCTALTLTGFGLRDSVQGIVANQYNNVFHYDKLIALNTYNETLVQDFKELDEIENLSPVYMGTISLKNENNEKETKLVVPGDEQTFYKAISLRDINNEYSELKLEDDEIVITKKAADALKIKAGDNVTIKLDNDEEYSIKVKAIVENYITQYSYLNKPTYEKLFGEYDTNALMLNLKEINEIEEKEFNEKIISNDDVASIITSQDTIDFVNNMISGLDTIIIIFIVAAASLAFVVLYNLSNINISERKREIATLKVLGFHHKEVDNYITKENIIFTIIGIAIGLFLGKFLCSYLIYTCETDDLIFPKIISIQSYIFAGLITVGFTVITNIFTHFKLKKIDMIESLKNVE